MMMWMMMMMMMMKCVIRERNRCGAQSPLPPDFGTVTR